jgi:hypothetical protein
MNTSLPSFLVPTPLPVLDDPIDEEFLRNPLDDGADEGWLERTTKKLVRLYRAEIEEYNRATEAAREAGTKRSGSTIKAAQRGATRKLSAKDAARAAEIGAVTDAADMF